MWRRKILILIFIILTMQKSYSQIYGGMCAGINFSTITYDNKDVEAAFKQNRKLLQGVNAGLSMLFAQNEVLIFNTDIVYSQKGMKTLQATSEGKNHYGYLQVDFLGKYAHNINKNNYLTFGLGPFAAFWATGKYVTKDLIYGTKITEKIDFRNTNYKFNRWDAGIIFSVGYLLKTNYKALAFDLRYEIGAISNAKENVDGSKNKVLSINMFYYFKLK